MTRTMLSSLAAAAIFAIAVGGTSPAEAEKAKRNKATPAPGSVAVGMTIVPPAATTPRLRGSSKGKPRR